MHDLAIDAHKLVCLSNAYVFVLSITDNAIFPAYTENYRGC